ncbi:MAG: hypothetical protein ACI9QQ_002023 [Myxococcota bacterium]|jgi:hypothetical protein
MTYMDRTWTGKTDRAQRIAFVAAVAAGERLLIGGLEDRARRLRRSGSLHEPAAARVRQHCSSTSRVKKPEPGLKFDQFVPVYWSTADASRNDSAPKCAYRSFRCVTDPRRTMASIAIGQDFEPHRCATPTHVIQSSTGCGRRASTVAIRESILRVLNVARRDWFSIQSSRGFSTPLRRSVA